MEYEIKQMTFEERVKDLMDRSIPSALKAWGLQVPDTSRARYLVRSLAIQIARFERDKKIGEG